ncbi:MAG: hypothetical protein Fur0037_13440 [Planctomycetota bacterium]
MTDRPVDRLATESVGMQVLRLGLPQAVGLSSHALVNVVDLWLVGMLGPLAVAAAHVASTINFIPMVVGNGFSVATLALLSQRLGGGDRQGARRLSNRSQWLMLRLGLVISIVSALLAPLCVDTVGLRGGARSDAIQYLVVSNLGCIAMFALMQTTTSMRALGEVAMPLVLLLGANLLNLLLDIVLLFGWSAAGIPALGVVGAAYASVASRLVAAVVSYWWLRRKGKVLRLRWLERRFEKPMPLFLPLMGMALPQVGQVLLRALLIWMLTICVQRLAGEAGVAALGVATRLDTMVLFAGIGFASAATTITGRACARGDARRARAAGLAAALQALAVGGAMVFALWMFAEPVARAFLPKAEGPVVGMIVLYLGTGAWSQPVMAFALGAIGAVQGAGRMWAPLWLDLAAFALVFMLLALGVWLAVGLFTQFLLLLAGSFFVAGIHAAHLWFGPWAAAPRAPDAPESLPV